VTAYITATSSLRRDIVKQSIDRYVAVIVAATLYQLHDVLPNHHLSLLVQQTMLP
jgi:hypothetical protein